MSYYAEDATAGPTGMTCEYGLDEMGTLLFLIDVCRDAADGASRLAELFEADGALEVADVFRQIAEQREEFAARLRQMLEPLNAEVLGPVERTFPGRLFRWRLQIARHLALGHRTVEDHHSLLRIAREGSTSVLAAYASAEQQLVGCESREEVHNEAEEVRSADSCIARLAA